MSSLKEATNQNNHTHDRQFADILIKSIDEGLTAFGEQTKNVTYHYLERNYRVKRNEIPQRLEEFHTALTDLFGVTADIIEDLVHKNLYKKLDLTYENKKQSLKSLVQEIKNVQSP